MCFHIYRLKSSDIFQTVFQLCKMFIFVHKCEGFVFYLITIFLKLEFRF